MRGTGGEKKREKGKGEGGEVNILRRVHREDETRIYNLGTGGFGNRKRERETRTLSSKTSRWTRDVRTKRTGERLLKLLFRRRGGLGRMKNQK